MSWKIQRIKIHHFRSISDLQIDIPENLSPTVICGPNNVGKTNILRALNLFFYEKFDADEDIPYHIAEGSRGQGYKSTIEVIFFDQDNGTRIKIRKEFNRKTEGSVRKNIIKRSGHKHVLRKGKTELSEQEINKFLNGFWFVFVEASNINLPKIIAELVKVDVLSLGLDRLRKKQEIPLEILHKFVEASRDALKGVEEEIGNNFKEFIKTNDIIKGLKTWDIEINFPEFNSLRDAIADMVNFTLYDANKRKLDSKGSGIQRILFLSLVRYISSNTKKNVIWGLDEPELFLQPGLQKEVFKILKELAKGLTIIFTTHSHHFIDINEIENCLLLSADYEIKKYQRRPDEEYFKVDTKLNKLEGFEKIAAIKKQMGINNNDSWEILPYNLLVEGDEDKNYLITLMRFFDLIVPNIFSAAGVDKMPGYLSFLNNFAEGLSYRPKVICIFDHDLAGKEKYNGLNIGKYKNLDIEKIYVARFDGLTSANAEYEIEDLIYPEIIIGTVNEILKKKNYNTLNEVDVLTKRKQKSYLKDGLLKILKNEIKNSNQGQEALDLESIDMKVWVNKLSCLRMTKAEILRLDLLYPEVRKFITGLCKST